MPGLSIFRKKLREATLNLATEPPAAEPHTDSCRYAALEGRSSTETQAPIFRKRSSMSFSVVPPHGVKDGYQTSAMNY